MRHAFFAFTFFSFFGLACAVAEEIYKTVDEKGKVTYTDTPQKEADKVELEEANTLPPPPNVGSYGKTSKKKKKTAAYQLYILSPENGFRLMPTQKRLTVSVKVNRRLTGGHLFQLLLNGSPHGEPTRSTTLTATSIGRGQHSITVNIVNDKGQVLASSAPVTIHAIRPNPKAPK